MVYSILASVSLYFFSMAVLPEFDPSFILTLRVVWKVAVITAVSATPLYVIKAIKLKLNPPSYLKLS